MVLTEIGPSVDLRVRRTSMADQNVLNNAMRTPKETTPKKRKNVETNAFGETIGTIHMPRQVPQSFLTFSLFLSASIGVHIHRSVVNVHILCFFRISNKWRCPSASKASRQNPHRKKKERAIRNKVNRFPDYYISKTIERMRVLLAKAKKAQ